MHRAVPAAALAVVMTVAALSASQALTERDASNMQQKLQAIVDRGDADPASRLPPLTTSLSEREVNAYLRFVAAPDLPVGLVDPTITIADRGRVSARAQIDLDAVRKSKPRGTLDPLAYVSGVVEVTVAGALEASGGRGKFDLEAATLGGMPVPETLVQELVTYFTRTTENPAGVSLARPFELPARIQQVRTRAGQATIVQ